MEFIECIELMDLDLSISAHSKRLNTRWSKSKNNDFNLNANGSHFWESSNFAFVQVYDFNI
jgi:hypothetical protein